MSQHQHHEPLQSQINNFVSALYGSVTKTEDEATETIQWTLPCGLDVGIPSNPRGADEGIACYFLRLMLQVAQANQGAKGVPGLNGLMGSPAVSVTISSFTTPAAGQTVSVLSAFTVAIRPQMFLFIQASGWYQVLTAMADGTLTLQSIQPDGPVGGIIPPGAQIVPVGPPTYGGPGIRGIRGNKGPKGNPGVQGPQGYPGNLTTIHGESGGSGNKPWVVSGGGFAPGPATFDHVDFTLPMQGNYLLIGRIVMSPDPASQPPGAPAVIFPQVSDVTAQDLSNTNNIVPLIVHMEPGNIPNGFTPNEFIVFGSCAYYTPFMTTIRVKIGAGTGNAGWKALGLYSWILIAPTGPLPPSQPPPGGNQGGGNQGGGGSPPGGGGSPGGGQPP